MKAEELASYLKENKSKIESALDRLVPPLGAMPPTLHRSVRHTLLSGGKRIRGSLVLACSELGRGSEDAAILAACAVEMVHASSLILDDLPCMDDADLRRGQVTLHKKEGEANAILAAVELLNTGFLLLQQAEGVRPEVRREITAQLAHAIGGHGLIGGQVVDLEAVGQNVDLEALEYIHSHKTGALFIGAAQIGALLGGAKQRELDALHRYAKNLGLAFQVTDDLLDRTADVATTGKDAGQDADRITFVDLCGIEGARALVDDLIAASIQSLQVFGKQQVKLAALAELVHFRDR